MSDDNLRRLEREWLANPSDLVLLEQVILKRERAGQPLSGEMLEARTLPAREFQSELPLQVQVLKPGARNPRGLGRTLGKRDKSIQIPPHCTWWALPIPPGKVRFDRLRELVIEESIPGLSFEKKKIDDRLLESFSDLELTFLSLTQCRRITDRGLKSVATLRKLGWLDLQRTSVTDVGLSHLVDLPQLFSLRLWPDLYATRPITAQGIRTLATCQALKHLTLFSCALDAQAVAELASLTRLQRLELGCHRDLRAEDLAPLGALSDLRELSIDGVHVEDLHSLGGLTTLRRLTAPGGLRAEGLKSIAGLPNLERLELGGGTTITDELLEVLATFPALETLDLAANTFNVTRGTAGLPDERFDLVYQHPSSLNPRDVVEALEAFLPHCTRVLPRPKGTR